MLKVFFEELKSREIPKIIDCTKLMFFILDKSIPVIQNLNAQVDSHCKYHKMLLFKKLVETIYLESGFSDPIFTSIEHARKGFRTYFFNNLNICRGEYMVAATIGKDIRNIAIIVQIERKKSEKKFGFFDEVVLKSICNVLSFQAELTHLNQKNLRKKQKYKELVTVLEGLLSARSQVGLIKSMREYLPKFHKFDDLGLLYYNEKKNQLYTLYVNPLLQGTNNIQAISFPSRMGVSGEIVKEPKIWLKDYKANQIFNCDIDNILNKKDLRSYLFAPLFNSDGKLNGIIHLINKSSETEITEKDIEKLKSMAKMYGLLIERVNEKDHIMHTLAGLKLTADVISEVVNGNEIVAESNSQISNLVKSMRDAEVLTKNMMGPKRELLMEKLSGASILNSLPANFIKK